MTVPTPSHSSFSRCIGSWRARGSRVRATRMEVTIKAAHSGLEVAEQLLLDLREVGRLMRMARLQFGIGADDAQDLLQETALDVVRERAGIRHPRAYVTRVFYMQCCQYVRRAVRSRSRLAEGELPDVAIPEGPAAEDLLALRQALGRISPGCRGLLKSRPGSGSTRASENCGSVSKGRNESGGDETSRRGDPASSCGARPGRGRWCRGAEAP